MTSRHLRHLATTAPDSLRAAGHHLSQPYNACRYTSSPPSIHIPASLDLTMSPTCEQREAASQEAATAGNSYSTGSQFPSGWVVPDSTSIQAVSQPPLLISDTDNGFQQQHTHQQTELVQATYTAQQQQPMGLPLQYPTPEVLPSLQLPQQPGIQLPQQPGLLEQPQVQFCGSEGPGLQSEPGLQQLHHQPVEVLAKLHHEPEQQQTRKLCHMDHPNPPVPQLIPVVPQAVVKTELGFSPNWHFLPKQEETSVLHHDPPGLHHPPPPLLQPDGTSFCKLF